MAECQILANLSVGRISSFAILYPDVQWTGIASVACFTSTRDVEHEKRDLKTDIAGTDKSYPSANLGHLRAKLSVGAGEGTNNAAMQGAVGAFLALWRAKLKSCLFPC